MLILGGSLFLISSCITPKVKLDQKADDVTKVVSQVNEVVAMDAPESVAFELKSNTLFVSNVVGSGLAADGNGWIGKVDLNQAEPRVQKWIEGLDAPKGIAIQGTLIWVADLKRIVAYDFKSRQKVIEIKPVGARMLNDVVTNGQDEVFVSDTFSNKIYSIKNNKATSAWTIESPNGLFVRGDQLYVATWGAPIMSDWSTTHPGQLYKVSLKDSNSSLTPIFPEVKGNLDGLAIDAAGNTYISDYMKATIMRIDPKGKVTDLAKDLIGVADFIYEPIAKRIIAPVMGKNKVVFIPLSK